MNLALIGPGAMGEEHALAFARLGGVTPYVVAGPNEAQVREFAAAHEFGRSTLEPQEALTDPHVNIVVISSPNDFHAAQARTAIEHGKHVLIEIPVAMSLSDAEELTALARASSGVVMAAHISRYYPAVRRLRRQVEEGALTLRHLICAMGTDKRENRNWKGAERDWVDDLLWHHGLHVLDVVMHLFDNDPLVESKLTTGGRHPRHGGVMDAAVTLRFESGALATVALTYHAKKQFTRYAVVADETHIELAQDAPGAGAADLTEGRPFSELVDAQDGEFLAACRAGRPPPVPLDAVLPAMRLLHDLTSR